MVLPKAPVGDFYQSFNLFLDENLGAYYLGLSTEPFSDKFYFSGKVILVLSHYLTPLMALLMVSMARLVLSSKEWADAIYLRERNDNVSGKELFFFRLCILITCYFCLDDFSRYYESSLTVAQALHDFFYGHYYRFFTISISALIHLITKGK